MGDVEGVAQPGRFAALFYLYQQVLEIELPRLDTLRARRPERVWLPQAIAVKFPQACREFGRQYLFPSSRLSVDPR